MKQEEYIITGMHCASCARQVERRSKKAAGVLDAFVNLGTERLRLQYDESVFSLDTLQSAIEDAGFGLLPLRTEEGVDNTKAQTDLKDKEEQHLLLRFWVAITFAVPLLYVAMAPMVGEMWSFLSLPMPEGLLPDKAPLFYALTQFALTVPIVVAGFGFYTSGFKALAHGAPNMDSLIAVGTFAAISYSLYATWNILQGEVLFVHQLYFETAGVIIALILLGKSLEARSRKRVSEAIYALMNLAPKMAEVIRDGKTLTVPVGDVIPGDRVHLLPGAGVPVDGHIIEGEIWVDASMLTGESLPVHKVSDDAVYGGTLIKNGSAVMKATRVGEATMLAQIVRLVAEAQGNRPPIARLADLVSGYFVQGVFAIAIVAAGAWLVFGASIAFAINVFTAVLVIACPCALGLATPTALMVGIGRGAELGILVKSGAALEACGHIDTVVFDKTGTITKGEPSVVSVLQAPDQTVGSLLQVAADLEVHSEHPLAGAILQHIKEQGIVPQPVTAFKAVPGYGVTAEQEGVRLVVGKAGLLEQEGIALDSLKHIAEEEEGKGHTLMFVAKGATLLGCVAVADTIKPSSAQVVSMLHALGIHTILLTGDNKRAGRAIAQQVGIDVVVAEVLPSDKAQEIARLQSEGRQVLMVGDGINDAPALAQAHVGMAVKTGTDVAIESADIVLMRSDMRGVETALRLSKATLRNIRQNLFWAFFYNALGIPLAAGVVYALGGPLLNPMFAALAMALSSVSVVSNALRLRLFK